MPRKSQPKEMRTKNRFPLEAFPASLFEGDAISVRGAGWGMCPLDITMDGHPAHVLRVSQGQWSGKQVRPDASGEFEFQVWSDGCKAGKHRIGVTSSSKHRTAARTIDVMERPGISLEADGEDNDVDLAYWRNRHFFNKRFAHLGYLPEGVRQAQVRSIRLLRQLKRRQLGGAAGTDMVDGNPPSMPQPGVCNWVPVGAGPVLNGPVVAYAGRTLCVAIDPAAPNTVYIGTAHGGVWKSTDGGQTWAPKSDYQTSLAIGAAVVDPSNSLRVFAGTGEYAGAVGTYYGSGLLRSGDAGNTWTELATATFPNDAISRILFDPTDATFQNMFLSSTRGVYQSTDAGTNWTQLRGGSASDLVVLIATGPPGSVQLIAGVNGSGLWTSMRKNGTWSAWTQIASAALPVNFARIALVQCKGSPQSIYAAFSSGGGIAGME